MDKQAEYGRQNGQGIAGETVHIQPRTGALELARILDAARAGRRPDPEDVAAVKALHPGDEAGHTIDGVLQGSDPADLIADLHSGDFERRRAAWKRVAPLLPADELRASVEIVDSWADLEAPTREWLIPAWLPAGRIGMVSGKGGKGKTWMLLQLAAAMATGEREWLGVGPPALIRQFCLSRRAPLSLPAGRTRRQRLSGGYPNGTLRCAVKKEAGGRLRAYP